MRAHLVGRCLDVAGWSDDDRDLDTGIVEFPRFWCERTKTLKALRLIEETETGLLEESADGKIVYRDRHARSKDTKSTVSQATYSDASGAALAYSHIQQIDPLKFVYNELRAKLTLHTGAWILGSASLGIQTELAGDDAVLWTHAETGGNSPAIEAGATRTFTASFPIAAAAVQTRR
jgi:hypothetical protein